MKINFFIIIFIIISAESLEDFGNEVNQIQPNYPVNQIQGYNQVNQMRAINPKIAPLYSTNTGILPTPCSGNSGNSVVCNNPTPNCPSFCNQYPQLCSQNCRPTYRTVIVQVPVTTEKKVPVKVTKIVPKVGRTSNVPKELEKITVCPPNHDMKEDENDVKKCVETRPSKESCPDGFVTKHDEDWCIKTNIVCANEYTSSYDNCTLRFVCPQNYIQRGDKCLPPEPQCKFGWKWSGRACEPMQVTCQHGYKLNAYNRCEREERRCPLNHNQIGGRCVKDEPTCPPGFFKNRYTNICEKEVSKCPSGSYEQYNECMKVEYVCPPESLESDGICTTETIQIDIVRETTLVNQTLTVPGPMECDNNNNNIGNGGSPCYTPCENNCVPYQ